jgi:hypothetical protein
MLIPNPSIINMDLDGMGSDDSDILQSSHENEDHVTTSSELGPKLKKRLEMVR